MAERTKSLEEMIKELPDELHQEVEDFIEFLIQKRVRKPKRKFKYDWVGALSHLRDKYTSVELQHETLDMWDKD